MRIMDGVKTTDGTFYKPGVVRLGRSDKVNPQVLKVTLDDLVEKKLNPNGEKTVREASEFEKAINSHKAVDTQLKEMRALFDEAASSGAATAPEMSKKFEQLKRDKQSWSNQIERLRESGNSATRDADIKRRQVEQQILTEAHIICATLSGSARDTFQNMSIDFETVVIDEAAQCIELSALIPLKYGCSKCIMVGDPKQLPPTVLSREAARFQYEQSLFVRMQRNQPNDVHLLDTQYRMHPEISRFPSQAFYDGKLVDGPGMAGLRTQLWHEDSLLGPYRFYDVSGKHQTAPRGHSLINVAEVETAMELYRRLVHSSKGYDFTGKIGIITPYKSQLKLLGERFMRTFGPEISKTIEFNTTDAFQGRESEVIIFSCVRASDRGIGFLSDIRRMNVGITRAKSSLWILGNSKSLMRGEFWNAMIQDAQARDLFTQGNISALLRDTPKKVTGALKPTTMTKAVPGQHPPKRQNSIQDVKMESPVEEKAMVFKREEKEEEEGSSGGMDESSSGNSSSSEEEEGEVSTEPMKKVKSEAGESKVKKEVKNGKLPLNAVVPPQHKQQLKPARPANEHRAGTPGGTKRKRSPTPPSSVRDDAVPVAAVKPPDSSSLALEASAASITAGSGTGAHKAAAAASANGTTGAPAAARQQPRPSSAAPLPRPPMPRKSAKDDAMFIKPRQRKR